jgi:hypothetical protein
MAKAFTPSRSAVYGAPVQQASIDVARTMGAYFRGESDEEIQALYISQKSTGNLAIQKGRNALFEKITTQHAATPQDWKKLAAKEKDSFINGVTSGVTQPQAKQAVQMEAQEQWARFEEELGNAASLQIARNVETNFLVQRTERMEPNSYHGVMAQPALLMNIADHLEFVDENHNAGGLPAHRDVSTPEAAEYQKRLLVAKEVGDYAVQMAVASDDESWIDNANQIAPGIFDDQEKNPILNPDQIAELKTKAKQLGSAAKAQAAAKKAEAAVAANGDFRKRIYDGNLVNADGMPIETEIRNAMDAGLLTPATMTTLLNNVETKKKMMTSGEGATQEQRWDAYADTEHNQWRLREGLDTPEEYKEKQLPLLLYMDEADGEQAARYSVTGPKTRLESYMEDASGQLLVAASGVSGADLEWVSPDIKRRYGAMEEELKRRVRQKFEKEGDVDREEFEKTVIEVIQWDVNRQQAQEPAIEPETTEDKGPGWVERAGKWIKKDTSKGLGAKGKVGGAFGGMGGGGSKPKKQAKESELPHPKTKEEVDALPSGTVFIAPDGKRKRKP